MSIWLCSGKPLFMDNKIGILYTLHVSQNIFLPLISFQPFKNVTAILNLWAIKKQKTNKQIKRRQQSVFGMWAMICGTLNWVI